MEGGIKLQWELPRDISLLMPAKPDSLHQEGDDAKTRSSISHSLPER